MCSCFISYPGFVRYHMPHLRFILSTAKSVFKSIRLPNRSNGSSAPSSTKRLASQDAKVTLSSRINVRGGPISHPVSVFAADADWLLLSEISRNSSTRSDNATRREYYEGLAEKQRSQALHAPSLRSDSIQGSSNQTVLPMGAVSRIRTQEAVSKAKWSSVGGSAWWKNSRDSNTLPTGYWDVMSFFRRKKRSSSTPTKMHSTSDDSAV